MPAIGSHYPDVVVDDIRGLVQHRFRDAYLPESPDAAVKVQIIDPEFSEPICLTVHYDVAGRSVQICNSIEQDVKALAIHLQEVHTEIKFGIQWWCYVADTRDGDAARHLEQRCTVRDVTAIIKHKLRQASVQQYSVMQVQRIVIRLQIEPTQNIFHVT